MQNTSMNLSSYGQGDVAVAYLRRFAIDAASGGEAFETARLYDEIQATCSSVGYFTPYRPSPQMFDRNIG
jgi:hypothetical protein